MTKTIPVEDIAKEIKERSGKEPSRDSVRKWIRDGYRGVKLRVSGPLHFRFTRTEWLDEFLDSCGNAGKADREFAEAAIRDAEESKADYEILAREFGIHIGKENESQLATRKRTKKQM